MSDRQLLTVQHVLDLQEPPWLVDRVLPTCALAVLWGPTNIGKSFVALDLACSVVAGRHWLRQPIGESGPVVYVAAEGVYGFKRRVEGWLYARDMAPESLADLYFTNWAVQLHEGVEAFLKLVRPVAPKLIIFDTLAACSLGIDEDSTEGMGPVMKSMYRLRKELQATVLTVHHTGWSGEHERGSSSLRGNVDLSIEVVGEKGWNNPQAPKRTKRFLDCIKQRDAARFDSIPFRLEDFSWAARGHIYTTKVLE